MNQKRYGEKNAAERLLDELDLEISRLEKKVAAQEKLILNRTSIRDWDLQKMKQEKAIYAEDQRELKSVKRKKEKMEGSQK